ncbi:M24 family peptidase [Streptomyces sp. NPDC006971]|uniref:M24 family peptidase n=1 Tax=Streptomyces sp. NPDC006971 TaxID=3154784 RepID=UPI0033E9E425
MDATLSLTERDRRWRLARDLMRDEGLDALLVYGEHEMVQPAPHAHDAYFTNDRPGAIVVFARDADPVVLVGTPMTIGDHIEARRRGDEVWIAPQNMRVARHPQGVLAVLREHGLERAAIGVIGMDPVPPWHFVPIMPKALMDVLTGELPHASFRGVYRPFLLRTAQQSAEELAVLAQAARTGDAMAAAMREAAGPGVPENEVYAAGMAEAFRRGSIAPPMIFQAGKGTVSWGQPAWAYRPQRPHVLEEGDVVLAEVFAYAGMKETQHQVAIAVGDVHPDALRAEQIARDAYEAGLAALRPGNDFGDLVRAMSAPLEEAGAWNVHPLVHLINPYGPVCGWGAGLRAQEYAQDYGLLAEIPTVGTEMPLLPGMSFSFEPNCVVGRHTVNLGGTVVVGESSPVELSPATARLLPA